MAFKQTESYFVPQLNIQESIDAWAEVHMQYRHQCAKFQACIVKNIDKTSLIFTPILQLNFYFYTI